MLRIERKKFFVWIGKASCMPDHDVDTRPPENAFVLSPPTSAKHKRVAIDVIRMG